MVKKLAKKLTREQAEAVHSEIIRIYDMVDHAQNMLERYEYPGYNMVSNAMPYLEQVTAAADVLSEHWCRYYEQGQKITVEQQDDIEKMLRACFSGIHGYMDKIEKIPAPVTGKES